MDDRTVAYAPCLLCSGRNPTAIANTPGEGPDRGTLGDATAEGFERPDPKTERFRGSIDHQCVGELVRACREEMASLERLAWRDINGISRSSASPRTLCRQAKGMLKDANATISHFIDAGQQWKTCWRIANPLDRSCRADGRILQKNLRASNGRGRFV